MAGDIMPPVTIKFALVVMTIVTAIVLTITFFAGLGTGYLFYGC